MPSGSLKNAMWQTPESYASGKANVTPASSSFFIASATSGTRSAIAIRVPDVEQARAKLEAAGVAFEGDTFDTGVCHMAFFSDPDGNALMLHHRYSPRDAASES